MESTDLQMEEMRRKKNEIDMIFYSVYNTQQGRRMFEYLKQRFVDVRIARPGDEIDTIFYRQGKHDLVEMMYEAANSILTQEDNS